MKRPFFLCASALLSVCLAACGGNVVVDGTGGAGASTTGPGAATTTSTTTGVSTFTATNNCAGAPMPLTCVGSGQAGTCGVMCDDDQQNSYSETCMNGSCVCSRNGTVVCTCSISTAAPGCTGNNDCCFGL